MYVLRSSLQGTSSRPFSLISYRYIPLNPDFTVIPYSLIKPDRCHARYPRALPENCPMLSSRWCCFPDRCLRYRHQVMLQRNRLWQKKRSGHQRCVRYRTISLIVPCLIPFLKNQTSRWVRSYNLEEERTKLHEPERKYCLSING